MINILFYLIVSYYLWSVSVLLSAQPNSIEIKNILKAISLLFSKIIMLFEQLTKLLIKDLVLEYKSVYLNSNRSTNKLSIPNPPSSFNDVSESEYPFKINEICSDIKKINS